VVNEHIGSVFLLNETEPFLVVKPFDCSVGHGDILLSLSCSKFSSGGCGGYKERVPCVPSEKNCAATVVTTPKLIDNHNTFGDESKVFIIF
jgi:hypothetical protein